LTTSPKEKLALSSIFASLIVASLKLTTGVFTNSLGIISEGLHSTIDLIAVSATYLAIKKAESPPDQDHQYGHGKAENLASLLESILLFIIAIWIFYEAFERIYGNEISLSINLPSIAIIATTIVIDITRFRALSSASKRYRSPALEADSLHFSTDFLSTTIVLMGSIIVYLGVKFADLIAAIFVAIIILSISFKLALKSINILMDRAPVGLPQLIRDEAEKIEGIEKIDHIRVRESGSKVFVDLVIYVEKLLPLGAAHKISEELSRRITSIIPNSEVIIRTEPLLTDKHTLITKIRDLASSFPEIKNIHNIKIYEIDQKLYVDFHLELDGSLPLDVAHRIASELEKKVRNLDPVIISVTSHVEPIEGEKILGKLEANMDHLNKKVAKIVKNFPEIVDIHGLDIRRINDKLALSLHCVMRGSDTVQASHEVAERLEYLLKNELKEIERVTIHIEPTDD
jgi:cation diffusion facilitator family transporter